MTARAGRTRAGRTRAGGRARAAVLAAAALTAAAILAVAGCAAPATATKPSAPGTAGTASTTGTTGGAAGTASAAASCNPYANSLAPSKSPGGYVEEIRKRGYLIAGVDQNTYHFGFYNPIDENIEGFDIDMVNAVAQAIFGASYAKHIELKAISDADRVSAVQGSTVDIVAHTMSITCQRLQQIDFSAVYYNAQAELMVLKNTSTKSVSDIKGRRVCATTGSDDVGIIQKYGGIPVQVQYWTDCLVDLQQGNVVGVLSDDSILHGLAAQDPFAQIVAQPLEAEPYGLGISRLHPDFVRFVNGVLAKMESDGQWKADYAKWVGGAAPAPPAARYAG